MSLSTSSFENVPAANKAIWLWCLFFIIFFLAPVFFLTTTVDPYDSEVTGYRYDYDRTKDFRHKNVAQWAAFEIARDLKHSQKDVDLLFMGDSRTRQLTGGFRAPRGAVSGDHKIYNLGFGGASVYEQIAFMEKWKSEFPSAKTVIWQLDYYKLRTLEKSKDRSEVTLKNAAFPVIYFTDLNTIKSSIKWVREHELKSLGTTDDIQPSVTFEQMRKHRCRNDEIKRPTADQMKNYARLITFTNSVDAVQVLETVIYPYARKLEAEGWTVYYFMPPLPEEAAEINEQGFQSVIDAVNAKLRSKKPILYTEEELEARLSWLDAVHVCPSHGIELLDSLVARAMQGQ